MPESPFTFLGDELIHEGMVVSFRNGRFDGPDGEFNRDIVRHPGAVSAIAIDGDDLFLVKQYRAPIDDTMWEIPAGKKDVVGEPSEETIVRELEEEIGMRPATLEPLISLHHSPGFCDEFQEIFLATDLEEVPRRIDSIEEQFMVVQRTPIDQAITMALDGSITDAKSIIGILAAARRLGR